MKKSIFTLLLAFLLLLSACGEKPSPQPTPEITPSPAVETPEPTPTPYAGPINPLTGVPIDEKWVNSRPVAIMLNNIKQALPQQGNSQADIIYEVLAEGGITRMLGVFQTVDGVGEIGSVRSSRPYYLELALGHDAVYLHAGGSDDAYAKIKSWGVTALDCVRTTAYSALFWRDKDRIQNNGYEHSVLTSGTAIVENFPGYSFRQEHEEGYFYEMAFAEDGTPSGGQPASQVTVPFSNYKNGYFTYDAETGKYLVEEYGKAYIDGNTGEQVSSTNLIVIQTDCRVIDDYGRMSVDLTTGGSGYYACGGQYIPIRWSKPTINSQLSYTTTDGAPLTLGVGNSYVCVIPLSNDITAQ